jgi:ABC-type nitrate/sulfonate/bicarbonate transport system substrate-binding protein
VARTWKKVPLFALSLGLALTAAACSSGNSSGNSGNASGSATTSTHLVLNADGTPNLKGLNIPIATAGSHPGDEDTVGYIMEQTLKQWGAGSNLNLGEAPEGADAVVAGKIDAVNSDMPSLLNLPLEIFMPNQERMDYEFVSTTAPTLADLKGKTIDVGTSTSAQNMLMPALLQKAGLTSSDVHLDLSGSSSGASLGSALTTGRADGAWIHISSVANLQKSVKHLYVLARASDLLPGIDDSFWAATPAWLTANPAITEALCLAWIDAVKTFNDDSATWVSDAMAYTLNADPQTSVQADHATFAGLNLWSLSASGYSAASVAANYSFYNGFKEFSGAGVRPMSQVATYAPWNAAWQVYQAHQSAY